MSWYILHMCLSDQVTEIWRQYMKKLDLSGNLVATSFSYMNGPSITACYCLTGLHEIVYSIFKAIKVNGIITCFWQWISLTNDKFVKKYFLLPVLLSNPEFYYNESSLSLFHNTGCEDRERFNTMITWNVGLNYQRDPDSGALFLLAALGCW